MDFFPLPIFTEGSLRKSVVTTVWIGVLVISLVNLRFGWTYSGLVIPGYMVPLLLSNVFRVGFAAGFAGIPQRHHGRCPRA